MRTAIAVLLLTALPSFAADGPLVARPDAFATLVNPNCSHCVDEAKRRAAELRDDDPVLCWTRGYSDGGAIPIRFFLNEHRVISDSYGLFVYDPEAGYARGFAPSFTFRFHGWRNGVMVMKDTSDGTLYSCLSGEAFAGPRKGQQLTPVPTLTTNWGAWMKRYPHGVAYRMFDKYKPSELPKTEQRDSIQSRGKPDPRLKADELVLGIRSGDVVTAVPLAKLNSSLFTLEVGCCQMVVLHDRATPGGYAAYKLVAHQPRKFRAPQPNAAGVSPADPGTPLPPGAKELPPRPVRLWDCKGNVLDFETDSHWDFTGRATEGALKGWTLEPADAVVCKWFAWSAEYPQTTVFGQKPPAEAKPKKAPPMIAGKAEFLRLLPKPFGIIKAIDPQARTVTLLFDGEKVAKVWPVEPDAEMKVNGWWGRLEQFRPGDRVWTWLKLNRAKYPVAVVMLADELSEWDMHGSLRPPKDSKPPAAAGQLEMRRSEQKVWLKQQWANSGLPGTVTFLHVFSGEVELMLDHETKRWSRSLRSGDVVHLQASPPIQAVVKAITPWRERTQVRLVVGELGAADLKIGQRLALKMTPPAKEVDESSYPPDIDRPRTKAERIEWFLCSVYCVCGVGKDVCTGHFYTLASCNPNGCGAPNALRAKLAKLIDQGQTDRQIWDTIVRERGALTLQPHLLP